MARSRNTADTQTASGGPVSPGIAGKNAVINGGFDIWQRGTSISLAALATGYTADRWFAVTGTGVAATISRQITGDTTNLPSIQYAARVQRNSGQTGTAALSITTSLETVNSIPLAGKSVVVSFYARGGANFSASGNTLFSPLVSGTGTDQNYASAYTGAVTVANQGNTLTTTWQRFTMTGTVGATATELAIQFSYTPTGTAGANDYFEITGVQLELGSSATPFSRAGGTIQGELAACQRYYYRTSTGAGAFRASGMNITAAIADVCIPLQTTMRVAPSSIEVTGTAADYEIRHQNTNTVCSAVPTLLEGSWNSLTIRMTTAGGLTVGQACQGRTTTNGYIGWSAEL